MKKQIILNWSYSEIGLPIDAYMKQMTDDGAYYVHTMTPLSYGISQAGAYGPSHYLNITKALLILNRYQD